MTMFRTVIVGADGYSHGPDALHLAQVLVADGGELVLADALPDGLATTAAALRFYEAALARDARLFLGRHCPWRGLRVRVESIADASREMALRHLAELEDADLMVAGSPSLGRARRLLDERDEALPCPLAIAPPGYRHMRDPEADLLILAAASVTPELLMNADRPVIAVPVAAGTGSRFSRPDRGNAPAAP